MTGEEADGLVHDFIVAQGAYPSGVGFMGFPKSVCISPNDILCHGVPSSRRFEAGDWVNFDVTCFYEGFFGDTSVTLTFGEVDPEVKRLVAPSDQVEVSQQALYNAIRVCRPGNRLSQIAIEIEYSTNKRGKSRALRASRSTRTSSATASGGSCTRLRRCTTSVASGHASQRNHPGPGAAARHGVHHRADPYDVQNRRTAEHRPRQLLDRGTRDSQQPVGAHRADHGGRPRGLDSARGGAGGSVTGRVINWSGVEF